MKHHLLKQATLPLILCALSCAPVWAQVRKDSAAEPLTNAGVVKLVKAGFKEKTVIAIIGAREPRFDLSTERMIELKKNGVTEKVILAMLARQQGMDVSDEAWNDDSFFDDRPTSKPREPGRNTDPGNGGTADIFGSSSGSRAKSKSRGGVNGSAEGDIQTTGTATVRIIRPPIEGGGSGLKLEKVATLNNDSIIDLIEAGFSEGTIVRRIEQSPVEFDLSPAKVAELRRRRVTERILAAMKTAMGENPKANDTASSPNGSPGQQ
jgi:hypothetical protein